MNCSQLSQGASCFNDQLRGLSRLKFGRSLPYCVPLPASPSALRATETKKRRLVARPLCLQVDTRTYYSAHKCFSAFISQLSQEEFPSNKVKKG